MFSPLIKALHNLNIFDGEKTLTGWGVLDGASVVQIGYADEYKNLEYSFEDAQGGFLSPKLVETHVHGGNGNSNDDGAQPMQRVLDFQKTNGVGRSFLSLVSAPIEKTLELINQAKQVENDSFLGLHLEGPFISTEFKGAHNPEVIHGPTDDELAEIIDTGDGIIRSITIAPELTTKLQVQKLLDNGIMPCFGHSSANYEQAKEFFGLGSEVMTHAFNAMKGIHHRTPGPIPAAFEEGAYTELIADGVHVQPAAARLLNPEKVILVTDAMAATAMEDGDHTLGSLKVTVRDGVARTESGAIAGSTLMLKRAVKNYAEWIGSAELSLKAAITNPALAYGLEPKTISKGETEWLLWDSDLNLIDQSAN